MPSVDSSKKPSAPADPLEIIPPERTTPALLMSLVLHVLLLTSIGLIWGRVPQGTGEVEDRPVGIALVHRMPDRDRYVDASQTPPTENEAAETADASSAASAAPPADLSPRSIWQVYSRRWKRLLRPYPGAGWPAKRNSTATPSVAVAAPVPLPAPLTQRRCCSESPVADRDSFTFLTDPTA